MAGPLLYDRVKETTSTTGTGTLTLLGAATGYRSFSVVGMSNLCFYCIEDMANNAWEVGVGTYNSSGNLLSRDEILASSNAGSAVSLAAGTKDVYLVNPAAQMLATTNPCDPGGRLTLTTAVPITTSDVNTASTLYYAPHISNRIDLWNGRRWVQTEFTEKNKALSSLTSGLNYDVFGFLSSGALALDTFVAWTNDTTRATAITLTDGKYTKDGDKTRLYLGTFRTISTSATRDSVQHRFLWNAYNRSPRPFLVIDTTNSWTTTNATFHSWNSSTANRVEFVLGLSAEAVELTFLAIYASAATHGVAGIGLDSTSSPSGLRGMNGTDGGLGVATARYVDFPGIGYHFLQLLEAVHGGGLTGSFYGDFNLTTVQAGANGAVQA